MISYKFLVKISPIFLIVFWFSCLSSPERNNPLDLNSETFSGTGTITGQVVNFYEPFINSLSDVNVTLHPQGLTVTTNSQGRFTFENVKAGAYQLIAVKPAYAPDTSTVMVEINRPLEININLDALPQFTSISATSRHIKRNFPSDDQFFLEVTAEIKDLDGNDIDLIELDIPNLAFRDTLDMLASGIYVKILEESELPLNSLHDLPGIPIRLIAHDFPGFNNTSGPVFVSRVIDQTPVIMSPEAFELVTPTPELKWGGVSLPFSFTFTAEVIRAVLGVEVQVWEKSDIDPGASSIIVTESLPAGTYLWGVAVVDDFGNRSRSLQGSFRIN